MYLGVDELLELVKKNNLVEGLCERELTNPEGNSFDLRLGELFTIEGKGFLGETERKTCDIKSVAKYEEGKKNSVVVKPGDFYLFKTIEKVNMPKNLVGMLSQEPPCREWAYFCVLRRPLPGTPVS